MFAVKPRRLPGRLALVLPAALVLAGCAGSPGPAADVRNRGSAGRGDSSGEIGERRPDPWESADLALVAGQQPLPGRQWHSLVWDPAGARLVLFGGQGGAQDYGDVWLLAQEDGVWPWARLQVSGVGPSPRHGHTAVWDAAAGRMIVFGGRDGSLAYLDDLWELSESGGSWTWRPLVPSGGGPSGRWGHTAVWDAPSRTMIVFGGRDAAAARNAVWLLSESGGAWTWTSIAPSGSAPSARFLHAAAWDEASGRMLAYGGGVGGMACCDDAWQLTKTGGTWAWTALAPGGPRPPGMYDHAAVWAPAHQSMLVFGGRVQASPYTTNAVWALSRDGAAWTWSPLAPSGTAPAARTGHRAAWDPQNGRMFIGGGYASGYAADVWELSRPDGQRSSPADRRRPARGRARAAGQRHARGSSRGGQRGALPARSPEPPRLLAAGCAAAP